MALLTHNFSKLPPPFPAVRGLAMQDSSILEDFTPAAFPWAVLAAPLPSLLGPLPPDQLLAFGN